MDSNLHIDHQDRRLFNQRGEMRLVAAAVGLLALAAVAMIGGLVGAVLVEITG